MKLHLPSGLRKALLACITTLNLPVTTFAAGSYMFGSAALVSFALSPFATASSDPFVIPNVWDDVDEKSMADEFDIDIDEILKSAPTSTAIVVGDLVGKDYILFGGGEEVNVKFVKTSSEGKTVFNLAGGGAAFVARDLFFTSELKNNDKGTNNVFIINDENLFEGVNGTIYVEATSLLFAEAQTMTASFSIGSTSGAGQEDYSAALQIGAEVKTTGDLTVRQDTCIGAVSTFEVGELWGGGDLVLCSTIYNTPEGTSGAGTLYLTDGGEDYRGALTFRGTSSAEFTVKLGEDTTLNTNGISGSYGVFATADGMATLNIDGKGHEASNITFTGVTLRMSPTKETSQTFIHSHLDRVEIGMGSLILKGKSCVKTLAGNSTYGSGSLTIGESARVTIESVVVGSQLGTLVLGNDSVLDITDSKKLTINRLSIAEGESATIRLSLADGAKIIISSGGADIQDAILYIDLADEDLSGIKFEDDSRYELFSNAFDSGWDVRLERTKFGRKTLTLDKEGCIVVSGNEVGDVVWAGGEDGVWKTEGSGWYIGETQDTFLEGDDVIFRSGEDLDGNVTIHADGVTARAVMVESGNWVFGGKGGITAASFTVKSGSVEISTNEKKNLGSVDVLQGAEFIISNATGWGVDQSNPVTGEGALVFKGLTLADDSLEALIKATLKKADTKELAALRLRESDVSFSTDLQAWLSSVSDIYVESGSSIGVGSASMNNYTEDTKLTLHLVGSGVENKGAMYLSGNSTVAFDIVIEKGGAILNTNGKQLELNGSITNDGQTITKIGDGKLWISGRLEGSGGVFDIQSGELLLGANLGTYEVKLGDNTALKSKGNYTVRNLYGSSAASLASDSTTVRAMTISNEDTAAKADKVYSGTIEASVSVDVAGGYWSFGGEANGALRVSGGSLILTGGSIKNGLTATGGTVKLAGAVSLSNATVDLSRATLSVDSGASLSIAVAGYTSTNPALALTAEQLGTLSGLKSILLIGESLTFDENWTMQLLNISGNASEEELSTLAARIINDLDEGYEFRLSADGTLSVAATVTEPDEPPTPPEPGDYVWAGGDNGTWSVGGAGWQGSDATYVSGSDVTFRRGENLDGDVTIDADGVTAKAVTVESGNWVFGGKGGITAASFTVQSGSVEINTNGTKNLGSVNVLQGAEFSDVTIDADGVTAKAVTVESGNWVFGGKGGITAASFTVQSGSVEINTNGTKNLGSVNVLQGAEFIISNATGWGADQSNPVTGEGALVFKGLTLADDSLEALIKATLKKADTKELAALRLRESDVSISTDLQAWLSSVSDIYVESGSSIGVGNTDVTKIKLHLVGSGVENKGAMYLSGNSTVAFDIVIEKGGATLNTNGKQLELNGSITNDGQTITKIGDGKLWISGRLEGSGGVFDIQSGELLLGANLDTYEVKLGDNTALKSKGNYTVRNLYGSSAASLASDSTTARAMTISNEDTAAKADKVYSGTIDASVSVDVVSGAWSFSGEANGELRVSGGSLILTGGSIKNGLTATGGTVKLAGAVSLSNATVDISRATLSVDSGASLSIAVAGYTSTNPALTLTAEQLGTLSGIRSITLTNTATWTNGYSLNLFDLGNNTIDETLLAALKDIIELNGLGNDLEWDLTDSGVLNISATVTEPDEPPTPPEPEDERWVWQGDESDKAGEMVWGSSCDNWNQDGATTPDGKEVNFEGEGCGRVVIQGEVTPNSIWVSNGEYEFSAAEEEDGGLNINPEGELTVGNSEGRGTAELKLSLKNKHIGKVNLLKGGTLTLNHEGALPEETAVVFCGGVLAYETETADVSAHVSVEGENIVRVSVGGSAMQRAAAEGLRVQWGSGEQSRAENTGVKSALTRGVEKNGVGTLALEWRETEDAELSGSINAKQGTLEYTLHAGGHTVRFSGSGVQVSDGAAVIFAQAPGAEGTLALAKAIIGQGEVQIGSAADSGSYQLAADNSGFTGTIRMVGPGSAAAVVEGALGGEKTTLVLAGRSLTFGRGVAAIVKVGEIVAEGGSRTCIGGEVRDAANAAITLAGPITGSGTLANATGGFAHTISGELRDFSGVIVAGAAGLGGAGDSTWTLSGGDDVELAADLAGTGRVIIDYAGETRLSGRVGSDDAENNSVSLETGEHAGRVIIADVDAATGQGKNTATGALRGNFALGDAKGAGSWAGDEVVGSLTLTNGRLLTPITTKTAGSHVTVSTAEGGTTVDAGSTSATMFTDIVIREGGHLIGVSGTLSMGRSAGNTTVWLCYSADNVGNGAGSSSTDYLMNISGGATLAEADGLVLDFSAEGFVAVLRETLNHGDAWLHTVQGGLSGDADDYRGLLGTLSPTALGGDSLPQLLRSLGFAVDSVQGGDIVLSGSVDEVYLVLPDGEKSMPHTVHGYNVLSNYKATVVDAGQTVNLVLQDAPSPGSVDALVGGARINNLVGLGGSVLSVRNTGKPRVTVVLSNESRDISETGGFDAVRAENTTFKGTLRGDRGVDLVKTGAGTLTIGDESTGTGGLQLADGDICIREGALRLAGGQNNAKSLTFKGENAAAHGKLIMSGSAATLTLEDVCDEQSGEIVLQKGALLKITGDAHLENTPITAGDDAEGGTLCISGGAVVELGSPHHAQLQGIAAQIAEGGALAIGSAKGNTLTALSGAGELVGRDGTELSIIGTGGAFAGSLSGAGELVVCSGAELQLVGASSGPADAHNHAWTLRNKGTLVIDTTANKAPLRVDSLTLSSGSTTTLRVDTDLHNADLLGGGTLSIEEGARLIISSTGDKPLIGRSITLAYFDGSNEELHLAEGNISLKGKALLPYKAGDLYFEDGRLMLRLLAQTRNVYISPNMPKNARAGAALLWALELANHKPTQAGSHLAAVRDVVQQAYDENAMGKVTHTLAAVAGASTAVLSNALAQDVRRQLESVRNRCAMADTSSGLHFRITGETAYHKLDANGLAPGFTLNGWGGSVGVDADLSSRTACGLAISAMYNDLKTSSADNGDLDTAYLSAYARTTRGKWNHSLTATVGTADVSFNRTVNYGPSGSYSAQGATDGLAFGIMYEVGYSFILKRHANMLLQPVMNVQYSHAAFSGYTESGTDAALRVDDMEQNQLTLGLGARLQRTLGENAFNRPAFFEGRALAKVELGDRSGSASTTIAGARIAPAEVESAKVGALGIELGVGISLPLSQQRSTIFADASAEFRTGYTTFNATLGYQITF